VKGVQIYLIGVVLEGNQDAAVFVLLTARKNRLRGHVIADEEAMNSDGPHGALVKDFLHFNGGDLRLVRVDQTGVSLTTLWEKMLVNLEDLNVVLGPQVEHIVVVGDVLIYNG
jgi:hypothetical protein